MNGFSDRNVDYGNLWRLLRQRKWQEANEETLLKLLEASGRIEALVRDRKLSQTGMTILFQLFDTNGRLKMLEALVNSDPKTNLEADIKALLNLLDPADREFYLCEAIETSKSLGSEQKKFLHRLIDLPTAVRLHPGKQRDRHELFRSFVLGWEGEDWHLLRGDIERCPCRDLQTIDSFWSILSDYRFGFSVQARIWLAVNGNLEDFGHIVGWRCNNAWIDYGSVTFTLRPKATYSIENARYGHLPFFPRVGWWHWGGGMDAIIKRLLCCNCLSPQDRKEGIGEEPLDSCNWLPAVSYPEQPGRGLSDCTNPPCPYGTYPCPCMLFEARNYSGSSV